MKLLILCPYPVFPPWSGGRIRVLEIARELARLGVKITLATPYKPEQRTHVEPKLGFEVRQIPYPFVIPWLLKDKPFPYGHVISYHPGLELLVRSFAASCDLVQMEHSYWGGLAGALPRELPVVYMAHNVEYDYLRSECRHTPVRTRVGRRAWALEKALVDRAARIVACSSNDRDRLTELYAATNRIRVTPHGIRELPPQRGDERRAFLRRFPTLKRFRTVAIFSGSNVEHNRVSARWILEDLAPGLRDDCGFVLHGMIAARFRNRQAPNVVFDDAFAEFGGYAHTGFVGLNPATQGSGANLKLLHYLAHGLPALSTEFGLRGYDQLRAHVTVQELSTFRDSLRRGVTRPPPPAATLNQYRWRTLAAGLKDDYEALFAKLQASE